MLLTYQKFDRIIKKYTPKDWVVEYLPGPGHFSVGTADPHSGKIHIPYRDSVEVLLIFLHEVAHIKYRHIQACNQAEWYQEYVAERWAYSVAIKEKIEVSEYRLRVLKAYVRRRYRRYLTVCKLYGIEPKRKATPGQLNWMGLEE